MAMNKKKKRVLILLLTFFILSIAAGIGLLFYVSRDLPKLITMEDYKPLLVTEIYSRDNKKIGEFFRERRLLTPLERVPKMVIQAFLAAEDSGFYEHKGVNYFAILRATLANIQAGKKVQGGSTITQQVAKTLFLSPEKAYTRKIKELFLAHQMEQNFSKEEILFLYLNQIYFGQGAYGIGTASQVYFRKDVSQLTIQEAAMLAGLPKAPSAFSPLRNPKRAKERQVYVIGRMREVGFITRDQEKEAAKAPLKIYKTQEFKETGPFFVETVRLLLNQEVGEKAVLDDGLKVYSSLDYEAQKAAEAAGEKGLRELDKRQGFRGAIQNLQNREEIEKFLVESRKEFFEGQNEFFVMNAQGEIPKPGEFKIFRSKDPRGMVISNIPPYIKQNQIVKGIVTKVDDAAGLTYVQFAEGMGLIDVESMAWARAVKPEQTYSEASNIKKPSQALKVGDVILVKAVAPKFTSSRITKLVSSKKLTTDKLPRFDDYAELNLEQDPRTETALVSLDLKTQEVLALVGGFKFQNSEFNRALQAQRQTGSSFKVLVYTSALDKGFTPASLLVDAPIVYENNQEGQGDVEKWKPHNFSDGFKGDVLFREALKRSLNIPAVKVLESVGVDWANTYAQRLGIFSPLNKDLSLVLGSSGVTLYEMTKAFAQLGRLGRRIRPLLIHKVTDHNGKDLIKSLSLDLRFQKELGQLDKKFADLKAKTANVVAEAPAEGERALPTTKEVFFSGDEDQLIRPTTAYLITNILQAAVKEPGGTAGAARSLGREAAGKTGTTNGYFDAWFVGFTPQVATGVWVGNDEERSIGNGETGGRAALPIWVDYMQGALKNVADGPFPVPEGIVFANVDLETGQLATANSRQIVSQAFLQGTEPKLKDFKTRSPEEEGDFFKEDMGQ